MLLLEVGELGWGWRGGVEGRGGDNWCILLVALAAETLESDVLCGYV